jgi:hypothetical protein
MTPKRKHNPTRKKPLVERNHQPLIKPDPMGFGGVSVHPRKKDEEDPTT